MLSDEERVKVLAAIEELKACLVHEICELERDYAINVSYSVTEKPSVDGYRQFGQGPVKRIGIEFGDPGTYRPQP